LSRYRLIVDHDRIGARPWCSYGRRCAQVEDPPHRASAGFDGQLRGLQVRQLLVLGGSCVLALAFPAVFQRVYVKPNELQLEAPYIQRNIALTLEAYKLRQITVKPFPAEQGSPCNRPRITARPSDNIRLWDWQPLMDTYAQLQEIRTYYKFHDVDVDRYELGGSYQ
jgi:uncharacterized membrane protein (UPF0182 family)